MRDDLKSKRYCFHELTVAWAIERHAYDQLQQDWTPLRLQAWRDANVVSEAALAEYAAATGI